jgi:predicted acetyltransferase
VNAHRPCYNPGMQLELRKPSRELVPSFVAMRDAFLASGDDRWSPATNNPATAIAHTDPQAYANLIAGWAFGDEFWILADATVVGELGIRYDLDARLRQVGGHIGYHVHPGYRNRGIATRVLREALKLLAARGESTAIVTCLDTNAASIRVIEKCSGRRIEDAAYDGPLRRRYAIALPSKTEPI